MPNAEQGGQLPKEEVGGVLPNRPYSEQALATTAPCSEIKGGCPEDKVETGDEKGPVEERSTTDKALEQFALLAGAFNLQLDEDLNRPDAKKYGVVGGRNANGLNHPAAQAMATLLQLSPLAYGQVKAFFKKYNEAAAKKATAVYTADELGKEAAEHLAQMDGAMQAIHQAGYLGPYKWWAQFTQGHALRYQAHHVAEKQWFDKGILKGDPDLVPSVILTLQEHTQLNVKLANEVRKLGIRNINEKTLWDIYKRVYAGRPEWLAAIKPYFPNVP